MIIGISGSANSGKDLLAKIIQYLTEGIDKSGVSYHEWNEETLWGSKQFDWSIVKFADPLKECAAIMLGCKKEDFEDRKFKENPLPIEWQDYFNDKNPLTPRKVLTLFGTDFARKNLSENVWINAVFSKYKEINGKLPNWIISDVRFPNELNRIKSNNGFIIKIERDRHQYFNPKKGDKIWIKPQDSDIWELALYKNSYNEQDLHECRLLKNDKLVIVSYKDMLPIEAEPNNLNGPENALKNYNEFDYIIQNDSTIENVIEQAKEILKKEKIL